jgi:hypothetical protein
MLVLLAREVSIKMGFLPTTQFMPHFRKLSYLDDSILNKAGWTDTIL